LIPFLHAALEDFRVFGIRHRSTLLLLGFGAPILAQIEAAEKSKTESGKLPPVE